MLRFPANVTQCNFQTLRSVGSYVPLGGATLASISIWVKVVSIATNQHTLAFISGYYGSPFEIRYIQEGNGSTNFNPYLTLRWVGNPSINIDYGFRGVVGQVYHLAMTFDGTNKIQNFYVNGTLVQSSTSFTTATALENPTNTCLMLGCRDSNTGTGDGNGVDFIVDEPVLWNGYLLTQSDVTAICSRSSMPQSISSGNIEWRVPVNYTIPTNTTVSDTQLAGSHLFVTQIGQPIGLVGNLIYVPPTILPTLTLGYSGKLLVVVMPTNITNIASNPTISINGGSAVTLTQLLYETGSNKFTFALYGLPTAVLNTDTVTLSASAGWIVTLAGSSPAITNQAIINGTGKELVPLPVDAPKSTTLGINISSLDYWYPSNIYNNQFKVAGDWRNEDGSVWTLDSNGDVDTLIGSVYAVTCLCTSTGGQPAFPQGIWTLKYDSANAGSSRLEGYNGSVATLVSTTVSGSTTTKVYNLVNNGNTILGAIVRTIAAKCTNIRVYPPGADTTGATIFHPTHMQRIKRYKCIRFMGLCQIQGSNLVNFTDWTPQSQCTYTQTLINNHPATLTTVTAYANADGFFDLTNAVGLLFTTASAHGYVDGQLLSTGTITLINTTGAQSTVNASNYQFPIHVINSTQFAMRISAATGTTTVTGTQTITGTVSVNLQSIMPIDDIINMVNSSPTGTDGWLSVPHLMTPSAQTALFNYLVAHTNSGHRWYIELSNEIWNYGSAFTQSRYFYGLGQNGDSTFTDPSNYVRGYQAYANAAGQMWGRATTAFASRPTDLIRVIGGQFTSTSLQDQLLSYLSVNNYTPDAFGIAPYFDFGPGTVSYHTNAAVTDNWDHSQLHDATQAWFLYGNFLTNLQAHKSHLASWFPSAKLVCYEGGQQVGAAGGTYSATLSRYWGRSPRMYRTLMYFWEMLSIAGVSMHNHFILASAPGYENISGDANWPIFLTTTMIAGRGDGSDGLYDNRTSMRYAGPVPTESIADLTNVVSVIAYAINHWQDIQPGASRHLNLLVGTNVLKLGATY